MVDLDVFKNLEKRQISGTTFFYLPEISGAYIGLYIIFTENRNIDYETILLIESLRAQKYAVGVFRDVRESVEAILDYMGVVKSGSRKES
ncbi:MAG: hypothetical protein FWD71_01430 [Oscillospiraceae bacterium]|nr:hypothetical protein [Oscillospiraceae bacterium]